MANVYDYLRAYNIKLTQHSGMEIARGKGPFYTHTGIVLGDDPYGNSMVFHNYPGTGPSIVTLNAFRNGKSWQFTGRDSDSRDIVLLRSFLQVDKAKGYSLLDYNCHHASSLSRKGKSASHGVNNTFGVLAFVALAAMLSGGENKR